MDTGFADIHHHLLYGLDDGPASFEEMARMIHALAAQGVRDVAATTHIAPGLREFPETLYNERLEEARSYVRAQGLPLRIHAGAEVLYTSMVKGYLRQGKIPLLGDSWHVLVEFHPREHYDVIQHALMAVCNTGHGAVLAHAERYAALRCGERLLRLRESCHVKIQMNCDAVISAHRRWGDRWIRRMLRENQVDIVATDAHNLQQRACHMLPCAQILAEHYGQDMARRLCSGQPRRLLTERVQGEGNR